MDAKELPIPETTNAVELKLFLVKLRDMLIEEQKLHKEEIDKLKLELEGAINSIDIIYKNLDGKRLHDYKTKKYFDIFS